jgi:hypothetical protein
VELIMLLRRLPAAFTTFHPSRATNTTAMHFLNSTEPREKRRTPLWLLVPAAILLPILLAALLLTCIHPIYAGNASHGVVAGRVGADGAFPLETVPGGDFRKK